MSNRVCCLCCFALRESRGSSIRVQRNRTCPGMRPSFTVRFTPFRFWDSTEMLGSLWDFPRLAILEAFLAQSKLRSESPESEWNIIHITCNYSYD